MAQFPASDGRCRRCGCVYVSQAVTPTVATEAPEPERWEIGDAVRMTLRLLRLANGMSQRDLSTAVGVARTYISKYETGRAVPSLPSLEKIAVALGTPLDVIIALASY